MVLVVVMMLTLGASVFAATGPLTVDRKCCGCGFHESLSDRG